MQPKQGPFAKRLVMMLLGILLISICVGSYRLSGFGVDAFTCMNLGISGFLHMSFGTWQLIMNAGILVVVFFVMRSCIGLGTIGNMVFVGYGADFICWVFQDILAVEMTLPLRIVALLLGTLCASVGVSFFMVADMGIAPYDSVAPMLEKLTNGKIPFQFARMCSDIVCILIGVGFCLAAKNSLWEIVGIGTICNACFNGPLIQFFRVHLSQPLLEGKT